MSALAHARDGTALSFTDQPPQALGGVPPSALGEPPVVLWLQGLNAPAAAWGVQLAHFSRTHRSIAPDARGVGKSEVEAAVGENIESLPYQPQEYLKYSLAAADVHLVTMGDAIRGIVHPSKVYGAMAAGRPIFLIGPDENHVSDLIGEHDIGWHVSHGDVDATERVLRDIARMSPGELAAMGNRARHAVHASGGKHGAVGRLCDVLERGV